VLLILAAVAGAGVVSRLQTAGWFAPSDESTRASSLVDQRFEAGPPNVVLLVTASEAGGVDTPAAEKAGRELTKKLAARTGVEGVASYWTLRSPTMRSANGRQATISLRVTGDGDQVTDRVSALVVAAENDAGAREAGMHVQAGGQLAAERETVDLAESDLRRSEVASVPFVAVVLLLVFGSAVAASLPLAVGLFAVVGTLAVLGGLTLVTDVSVFALNITTALGFGLAVDYGLFVVTRFREELDAGREPHDAAVTTVATAGRTVLFSALTVAISLSSLLVFPLYYLRSFAYAGVAVVALAAAAAIILVPALLAVLGHRIDVWPLPWLQQRKGRHRGPRRVRGPHGERVPAADTRDTSPRRPGRIRTGAGFWHELALFVMRRPWPVMLAVVMFLLFLGIPFLGARFALPDDRLLPRDSVSHQVAVDIRENFPQLASDTLFAVAPHVGPLRQADGGIDEYAARLSEVAGVERVDALTGTYVVGERVRAPDAASARFAGRDRDSTWFAVVTSVQSYSAQGETLARTVRALPEPAAFSRGPGEGVLVGGTAAHLVDTKHTVATSLPWAFLVVALATLAVLFLFTGSVLIPLKAVVLNVLTLTATYGALVWGFQEGHLQWLVGDFQVNNTLELTTPILMFCIAFGLSMDYEVFLLSRITEEHDRTGDTVSAVAMGLERTGRLVTSAAAVVVIVLAALATSDLTVLKMLGLGLALAVLVDASLVRGLLVPAFMRLAGEANWWAPGPLRRIHARWGLHEAPAADVTPQVVIGRDVRSTAPSHVRVEDLAGGTTDARARRELTPLGG
jgi:RND superfamily putative drug exporter